LIVVGTPMDYQDALYPIFEGESAHDPSWTRFRIPTRWCPRVPRPGKLCPPPRTATCNLLIAGEVHGANDIGSPGAAATIRRAKYGMGCLTAGQPSSPGCSREPRNRALNSSTFFIFLPRHLVRSTAGR